MAHNVDTRPLPEGWIQQYETSKEMWYYVQTNTAPHKVSFTHPADIVPTGRRRMSTMNQSASAIPPRVLPSPAPPMPQPQTQTPGRTFAQQLFASSMDKSAPSMINISNSNLAAASGQPSHPPINPNSHIAPFPPPPPSQGGYNYNLQGRGASSTPAHQGVDHHLHRTHSLPPTPPNLPNHMRHPHERAKTLSYGSGQGGYSSNTNTVGPPPQTPQLFTQASPPNGHTQIGRVHLVPNHTGQPAQSNQQAPQMPMQARPPNGQASVPTSPLLSGPTSATGSVAQAMLSPGPLSPLSLSNSTTPSPPSSSVLFSHNSTPLTSPASSPPMSPPLVPPYTVPPTTTIPSIKPPNVQPVNVNRPSNNSASSVVTQLATKVAVGIAGSYLSNVTGLPSGLFTSVGNLVTNPKTIAMFKSALSKSQSPLPEHELQAVLQGKPNANYQAVINALQAQQQQFQASYVQASMAHQPLPQQTVDYQALIAEIERLQKLSLSQSQAMVTAALQQSAQNQSQNNYQAVALQQIQNAAAQQAAMQKIQQQVYAQTLQNIQQQQQHQAAQQQAVFSTLLQQQQQQQQLNASLGQNHPQQAQVGNHQHQTNGGQHQQQQQQQNPYAQIYHQMHSAIENMQQQQQQQQQPQQQQPSLTDMFNSALNNNGQSDQSQAQQQPSVADIINSAFNGGQQPSSFDPSSLYNDPNSGSGGGILDSLTQSLASGSFGGLGDPSQSGGTSGLDGFMNGFGQALAGGAQTDPSAFTAGFDLGSFANSWNDSSC